MWIHFRNINKVREGQVLFRHYAAVVVVSSQFFTALAEPTAVICHFNEVKLSYSAKPLYYSLLIQKLSWCV